MVDADTISRAREVRIEDEVARRGIRLKGRVEREGACPVCGGDNRFAINIKKQQWNCRGCRKGGDVIGLVQHIDGCSFVEAVALLAGEQTTSRRCEVVQDKIDAHRDNHRSHDDNDNQQIADRIWEQAFPIAGTPAEAYLARRGITIADVPGHGGLRFHPRCPWGPDMVPAVVARFTDVLTNERRGIWRRPIDGQKPKNLGRTGGCCVRLWPDDCVDQGLIIGEGIETILSAAARVHRGTLLQPAWACASAGNLAAFPLLPGISALTIIADNDESGAGQRAAKECAHRWLEAGIDVEILTPQAVGKDFNDIGHHP
jgi:phage/plasmid primase-like uncharacterized protein